MAELNPAAAIKFRKTPNDVFLTPVPVVKIMIDMCDITPGMKVLDPCKATGNFYNNLPDCNKDWCEITEGKDYFDYNEKVDLVIGNPPYSIWSKWLDHTAKITDKFCYVFGVLNLTPFRLKQLEEKGFGLTKMHMLNVEWWFSHSVIAVFERNKPSIITQSPRVYCECGTVCNRGRIGYSPNECSPKEKKVRTKKIKDV
jgi:hypothetical protein